MQVPWLIESSTTNATLYKAKPITVTVVPGLPSTEAIGHSNSHSSSTGSSCSPFRSIQRSCAYYDYWTNTKGRRRGQEVNDGIVGAPCQKAANMLTLPNSDNKFWITLFSDTYIYSYLKMLGKAQKMQNTAVAGRWEGKSARKLQIQNRDGLWICSCKMVMKAEQTGWWISLGSTITHSA